MTAIGKEWLKTEQKAGAYYVFKDKQVIGEKFLSALLKRRKKGFFYLNDDTKDGFIASVYGIYELLSIADNMYAEDSEQKNISVEDQLSLANEIAAIYNHINEQGFDFAPIISKSTNKKFFLVTEKTDGKNTRQKYPYFGAMTWILSLSSLLWKKYFRFTETGKKKAIGNTRELISDENAVNIIRNLEGPIRDSIRHIVRLFVSTYITPEEIAKNLDVHGYGDDNRELIALAAEDGLKLGWGYTKKVKNPSLYFTFSILEAFSDFDSNILIGGKEEDYFFATDDELKKGMETTKNASVYDQKERLFNSLIKYINEDVELDASGNIVLGDDGKPKRVLGKRKYEEEFRKAALQCSYYLFYKFKDTISDSFYTDDGYIVTKQQVMLSSSSPYVFYPLYILSAFLNGEVNGTIKTKLMYTRRKRNERAAAEDLSSDALAALADEDEQIKLLEDEFRQFEDCFTNGLNNVQKIYSLMEKNDKLDVIDRHYLTFDQSHPENPQFSRMLSRENILAMPLLPLLVNVTDLYVLWITKFPDKQISDYIIDIFENYCNHSESGELEWVFEQGSYDLHTTIRYIDAIINFFDYYDTYERKQADSAENLKTAEATVREELNKQYLEKLEKAEIKHAEEERRLNEEIDKLNRDIANSDKNYEKVFNVENSVLLRFTEMLNQYVDCVHDGKKSHHEEAISKFIDAFLRVAILKISSDPQHSDRNLEEIKSGLEYVIEKRGNDEELSLANLFKSAVDGDEYIFKNLGTTNSDQN